MTTEGNGFRTAASVAFFAVAAAVAPLAGQTPAASEPGPITTLASRADSLVEVGAYEEALVLLRPALAGPDSARYALLWRAARAAVLRGSELPGPYPQNDYFEEAMRWGARADAESLAGPLGPEGAPLAPGAAADVTGGYWGLLATGLRARNASATYGASLASDVLTGGCRLLDRAPRDPRVHSLLGRLFYEVMSLSRVERLLGRILVGGPVFEQATWDRAERHLTRAVEEAPANLDYVLDLARLHEARGRRAAARVLAERVVGTPARGPVERAAVQAARKFLDSLGE